MAQIRPYQGGDFEAVAHICRVTLPDSLSCSPGAVKVAPYVWAHQFTHLSPSTCFVLDDGTGKAVGYVVGTPSIPDFVASYPSFISTILSRDIPKPEGPRRSWSIPKGEENAGQVDPQCLAQMAYDGRWLVWENREGLVSEYGATLHIDLEEKWRADGWGKKLVEEYVKAVRASWEATGGPGEGGGRGVHVIIGGENGKVVGFYERCGFKLLEGGEKEGTIWMGRKL
ncbi:hypothetical protein jhhlp_002720 [Lomentospora prolificans]|uniref:N-acetyltransferase domain-containing protein n=1 Tax=Lomentospora prolificans TaxID=41688 RepID=A0A2N3NEX7_9PEZI|nr:hypothetical protein jhhlp_002720 [Lomentospora prolificans]